MKSSNQTSKTNPTLMIDQYQQEMKMRKTVYSINPFYHGTSDRKKKLQEQIYPTNIENAIF